jgi:LPXTG-site transpeptidase (sortase) family protein
VLKRAVRASEAAVIAALFLCSAAEAQPAAPRHGEQFGVIRIPAITVSQPLYNGDKPSVFYGTPWPPSLTWGPAHYPETPFPWQSGVSMIAGHRVTHTHPFRSLNLLRKGNLIVIKTKKWGSFHYRLVAKPRPSSGPWVPEWNTRWGLLLSACDPPGQAWRRIVAKARLSWASRKRYRE